MTKKFRKTTNINRVCDIGVSPITIGFASWLVNGGGNGYIHRQQFAKYLAEILLDGTPRFGIATFQYPELTKALTNRFPPNETIIQSKKQTVNYERQSS